MRARQSQPVSPRRRAAGLPLLWLLSDARNDDRLEAALAQMPPGSAFVFRHYHLAPEPRRARFAALASAARANGHAVILADTAATAQLWGADGTYGPAARMAGACAGLRVATAHDGPELRAASRGGADAVFLSPVFPTRSHDGSATLGVHGFHVLAQQSSVPVIALGGMTAARARELAWPRWGAIDGLVPPQNS